MKRLNEPGSGNNSNSTTIIPDKSEEMERRFDLAMKTLFVILILFLLWAWLFF